MMATHKLYYTSNVLISDDKVQQGTLATVMAAKSADDHLLSLQLFSLLLNV